MRRIRELLLHNRFVGNTGWLLFQQIYYMALTLVVGALSARYLGPSNYGLIGYGTSLVNLFVSISRLGLDSVLMNELVLHPDQKGKYMGTAVCMRLAASVVSFFCVLVLVAFLEPGNNTLWVITALQAFAIICQSYEVLNEWFLAELKSRNYVIANSCGQTAAGAWKIVLLICGASVLWFAAAATIQALVCGMIVIVVFIKAKDFFLGFSMDIARSLFYKGKYYILSGLAVALYTEMDKVMVGKLLGETEVGYYTAAMVIAMLWEFVPAAIINSSKVLILEKKQEDEVEYQKRLQLLLLSISLMGLAVGLGMQIFGRLAVVILYGKKYLAAVPVLKLLIWSTSFAMIGVARNIWSLAEDKNKYAPYYTVCGSISNLSLNLVLIPVWGIFGAAVATLVSQIIVSLVSPLFWKDTRAFFVLYMQSWKTGWNMLLNIREEKG